MADQQSTAPGNAAPTGRPFTDMSASEKFAWLGKVVVMIFTGGFAFPNIFVE